MNDFSKEIQNFHNSEIETFLINYHSHTLLSTKIEKTNQYRKQFEQNQFLR